MNANEMTNAFETLQTTARVGFTSVIGRCAALIVTLESVTDTSRVFGFRHDALASVGAAFRIQQTRRQDVSSIYELELLPGEDGTPLDFKHVRDINTNAYYAYLNASSVFDAAMFDATPDSANRLFVLRVSAEDNTRDFNPLTNGQTRFTNTCNHSATYRVRGEEVNWFAKNYGSDTYQTGCMVHTHDARLEATSAVLDNELSQCLYGIANREGDTEDWYGTDPMRIFDAFRFSPPALGSYLRFTRDDVTGAIFVSYLPDDRPIKNGTTGWTTPGRMKIKVGKYILRMLPTVSPSGVETVVNLIKAWYAKSILRVELWSGDGVLTGYLNDNYSQANVGDLRSCMSPEECQGYIQWYAENPASVSLAVALDADGLVHGRSLVWTTTDSATVHDRIYGSDSTQVYLHDWFGENGIKTDTRATIRMNYAENSAYPYMDTYRYAYRVGSCLELHSHKPRGNTRYYELTSTGGDYDELGGVSCYHCGDDIGDDGGDDINDGVYRTEDGFDLCEGCYSDRTCPECLAYAHGGGYCDECEGRVCADCGEYSEETEYHEGTNSHLCPDCTGAYCETCHEQRANDAGICTACANMSRCADCDRTRRYDATGDFCTACTPVQMILVGVPSWRDGWFRTWPGERVHASDAVGYTHGLRYESRSPLTLTHSCFIEQLSLRETGVPGISGFMRT